MTCIDPLVANYTIADFKNLFFRDFKYLPVWVNTNIYNQGEIVYYATNKLFYIAKNNGVSSIPTTTADWQLYQDSITNYVQDADINKAFDEACASFNSSLYLTQTIKMAWLYLTAHFLVVDLRANGVSSDSFTLSNSKSVGNVSESYTIPQWILDNPLYSYYSKTSYGSKFLNMTIPNLIGNVSSVYGGTSA